MATIKHKKHNNIADWTQADVDKQIAAGNLPAGTVLADITLTSDWNDDHDFTGLQDTLVSGTNIKTINGSTILGSGDLTVSASPAGSDTNMQFNNSGAFGGANVNYNKDTNRTGFQVPAASTMAPVHAAAIYGDIVAAPSSLTATLVPDPSIDSPVTASATQVNAPTEPTGLTMAFNYIDQPNDNMQNIYQNTGETGFQAYGQTFTYKVFAYRMSGAVRVRNPNPFTLTDFTDPINDGGATSFGLDVSGWVTPNNYQDGFLLQRYDTNSGNTYIKDIGNVTSYNDLGFTDNDSYADSAYASAGSNWHFYLAQYKNLGGTSYRTGYIDGTNADGNIAGAYLILQNSWDAVVNDGFNFRSINSYFQNVNTATSFEDYGQVSGSDSTVAFSSVAFPYFDTSLTGATGTTTNPISYGSVTSFIADGSTWTVEIWEYRTNVLTGVKYFVSSPDTGSYGADDNSSSYMTFSGSFTAGDGSGAIVKLLQNGTVVSAYDNGSSGSFSFNTSTADINTSLNISSYAGLTRDFSAYGKITSPSIKYSVTHNDYSFTDTNPIGGYLIEHAWGTFGNATSLKVLENSYRSGNLYNSITTASYLQTNTSLGDSTVTPSTVGFLANGANLNRNYRVYSTKVVGGTAIYSSTYATDATTDPNDGLYYIVDLAWPTVSGATSKLERIVNGGASEYKLSSATTLEDNINITWPASSTLSPTTAADTAGIFDRSSTSTAAPANVVLRNPTTDPYTALDFAFSPAGADTYSIIARILTDTSGRLNISTGNLGAGGVSFSDTNFLPWINFVAGAGIYGTIFNVQGSSSRDARYLGASSTVLQDWYTSLNTVGFGSTVSSLTIDPVSAVVFAPKDTTDAGFVLYPRSGANPISMIARLTTAANSTFWGVTNEGRMAIRAGSAANGNLYIGACDAAYSNIQLMNGATVPSSPNPGGIELSTFEAPTATTGALYFTNLQGVRHRLQESLDLTTSAQFWYSDGYGYAKADSTLYIQGGVSLVAGKELRASQGITLDASKDLTMGTNSRLAGNFRPNFASVSANTTLNASNHSPFTEFTGSTSGRTLTLPTAASVGGVQYNQFNRASVPVTVATTSSQVMNYGTGTPTSITLQQGDLLLNVANNASGWDSFLLQYKTTPDRGGVISGSKTATGTATTTFTVTIGSTLANSTYKVAVTPTNALSAAVFYVTNKTTTTFDVVYLAGLTGSVQFDWILTY